MLRKKKKRESFLNRPYRSWINLVYVIMYYGKKITILSEFRPSETATHGYVAGMTKLGYIEIDVIESNGTYRKSFEAYMLD